MVSVCKSKLHDLASTRISFSVTPGTGWLDILVDDVSFLDEMLHGVVFFPSARVSRSPQCLAQNYQIKCLKFKCGIFLKETEPRGIRLFKIILWDCFALHG